MNDDTESTSADPFAAVRENEAAVETLTDRDDRIGAAARVVLALAHDEHPDMCDLEAVGIPVGPAGAFAETGGSQ